MWGGGGPVLGGIPVSGWVKVAEEEVVLPREGMFLKTGRKIKFHTGTSEGLATLCLLAGVRHCAAGHFRQHRRHPWPGQHAVAEIELTAEGSSCCVMRPRRHRLSAGWARG